MQEVSIKSPNVSDKITIMRELSVKTKNKFLRKQAIKYIESHDDHIECIDLSDETYVRSCR